MHQVRRTRRLTSALLVAIAACGVLASSPAAADEFDRKHAGHPLRLIAYVLHPIGYAVETLILRPSHWLVSREPLKSVFGHTD